MHVSFSRVSVLLAVHERHQAAPCAVRHAAQPVWPDTHAMPPSAVDLASQAVISFTEYKIKQRSDMYPVGRARLEVNHHGFLDVTPVCELTCTDLLGRDMW